jgi:hypothetical protein
MEIILSITSITRWIMFINYIFYRLYSGFGGDSIENEKRAGYDEDH